MRERFSRGAPAGGAVFAGMTALPVELLVECERGAQSGMEPCAVRRCEREAMDSFFKISERGSSVSAEVVGGITTFLAMAYVVAVNSNMMAAAGIPFSAALTSTCLGAAVATVAMGLIANRPIALASGMGLNAVVAFSICQGAGVDWRVAMAVVFVEGVAILLLVLCGLRTAIMDAIPADLRRAIAIGIGLFISFIGLSGSGLVVADPSTLIALGDLASPSCIVAVASVLCAVVFHAANVKGGLILSIVAATAVGVPLGVTPLPESWEFGLDLAAFAAPFQVDPATGALAIVQVFAQPLLLLFVFSLLMSDFFDTMGTVIAVGERGGFVDAQGRVEDAKAILAVDSAAAAAGGFLGASSITSYAESATGIVAGARTGFSNLVVGALFATCAFLSPIFGMVTSAATCGVLLLVGYLMLTDVGRINWQDMESAFPAFITIVAIPMTYSISNGIGLGFISYCAIMVARGRAREVKPLMWIAAAAFLVAFVLV